MNGKEPMQVPRSCPLEEEVILAFHDGEPGSAPAELAAHMETCPSCRRALKEVRTLEALVATHTVREITEEEADAFLSFLKPKVSERKGIPLGVPRLAALLLGALCLVWVTARPLPPPPPPRLQAWTILDLPAGFRLPRPARARTSWSAGEVLAALKGEFQGSPSSRPSKSILGQAALRLLNQEKEFSTTLTAARWLLEESPFPWRARLLRTLADRLFQSRGKERLLLADLYRSHRSFFFPSRGRKTLKKKDSLRARLAGALGYAPALDALASAPFPLQEEAAREALATGDRPSLSFFLDLYLEAALRSAESRRKGKDWFRALPPRAAAALLALLEEKEKGGKTKYLQLELENLRKILDPLSLWGGGGT